MKKLIMMSGIPASGKSTYATKYGVDNPNTVIVSKDILRSQNVKEADIETAELEWLTSLQPTDYSIVIDNTNLTMRRYRQYQQYAKDYGYEFSQVIMHDSFDVDLCHKRNLLRKNQVPVSVIETMAELFFKFYDQLHHPRVTVLRPRCIMVDIDGTLAHKGKRNAFDFTRVGEDTLDHHVAELVHFYKSKGFKIVIQSGRDDSCKPQTIEWLNRYNIPFDDIYMRKSKDVRKDVLVKYEMYVNDIRPKYDPYLVLEDRQQVLRLWRGLGIKTFQVASGWF